MKFKFRSYQFVAGFLLYLFVFSSNAIAKSEDEASPLKKQEDSISLFFKCPDKKWLKVKLFEKPVPFAAVELSDGRKLNLAQAISASGVRYTNVIETMEFWIKGDECTFSEGSAGEETKITYEECKTEE